jgi:molybdate-binding protein
VQHEHFDFVVPSSRARRPAISAFRELLDEPETRKTLIRLGMTLWP